MKINPFRVLLTVLAALLVLSLASCAGGGTDVPAETSVQPAPETTAAAAACLQAADLTGKAYCFVRPDEVSDDLKNASSEIYKKFLDKFGNQITIKTDYYKEGVAAFAISEYEILIGNTNRPESRQFLSGLRSDDYGYALIGTKLVIAGVSDSATVSAINLFLREVFNKYDGGEVFFSEEQSVLKTGTYAVNELKVGDVSIGEFRIVYPDRGENSEKQVAESLRGTVTDASGWVLEVVSDKTPAEDGVHEILVGLTSRDTAAPADLADDEAFVGFDGKNVRLWGKDLTALIAASRSFSEPFREAVKKTVTLSLNEKNIVKFDNTVMSAMSFNVLVSKTSAERNERVLQMVKNYLPDTVGFQEASPSWMGVLRNGLGDVYAYVGEGRDGGNSGEYNPIFYNRSKFDLLESGTRWLSDTPDRVSKYSESSLNRIYTYALLQRKADGAKIMVINTHFEHTSEDARNKQAKVLAPFLKTVLEKGYPVILTGDFNTTADKPCFATVSSSGVVSTAKLVKNALQAPTYHNWGASNKIIDFIFANPAAMEILSYRVCSEQINGDFCSDHHPVFVEYKITG